MPLLVQREKGTNVKTYLYHGPIFGPYVYIR
jgi:hypothetical protein